jgi:lysyl-tRNA synthetase class 2
MDRTHNPEFTILEFYVAYKDYLWMMETTEQLLEKAATDVTGSTDLKVGDKTISFKAPFKRIAIYDAIKEHTGFDVSRMKKASVPYASNCIQADDKMGKAS